MLDYEVYANEYEEAEEFTTMLYEEDCFVGDDETPLDPYEDAWDWYQGYGVWDC